MVFRKSIWWSTILNVGNKTRIHHWQYSAAFWSFFYKNRVPACESHMHKNALFKNDQRFLYFFMFCSFFVLFLIFFLMPFGSLILPFSEKTAFLLSCPLEYTMKKHFTKILWAHISELQLKIFVFVAFRVSYLFIDIKRLREQDFFLFPYFKHFFKNVSYQRRI